MKLAIDADGVICNFNSGFCAIADALYPGRGIASHVPTSWEDLGGLTRAEQGVVWKQVIATPNFWRKLPPYPDSVVALNNFTLDIPEQPHDIYVVTSRVATAGDSVTAQTASWLRRRCLYPPQVIVVDRKEHKRRLYELLRVDVSIDDNFDTFTSCYNLPNHQAWLLDRPWNVGEAWGRRVATLAEFFARITEGEAVGGTSK